MQIIQSSCDSFRYLWSPVSHEDRYSDYIAARNVAVGHLDPAEVLPDVTAFVERKLGTRTLAAGTLDLFELSERQDYRFNAILRPVLKTVTGTRKPRYIHPNIGVINGATGFHHDMPFSGAVFGAWYLSGPERVVRFSELDLDIRFTPGTVLLFDPAQPHAMLAPGRTRFKAADYPESEMCTLVSFMLRHTPKICDALGMQRYGPRKHKALRKTVRQYEPCPETGALTFQ